MTMSKITGGGGGATSNVSSDRRSKEESSCDGLVSAAESGLRALLIEGNKEEEEVSRARSIVFSSRLSKEESGYGGALITNIDNELPAGVWVLIVANDPLLLNNLEQKLQASLCKVTSCSCPFDASSMLLEEEEYKFDFVVSALSFDMRNKDAYDHMLEQLSIKAGVPPITMSSDDSGSVVMKGVTRGAGGYLIKPIGMQAIQNICQHVAQKWRNELKHSGSIDGRGQHLKSSKIWSYQINCRFNAALLQLGVNEDSAEAVPEKILELMNAPELTLEDVASHLQETRLELEKMKRGQNVSIKAQAKLKAKAEVSVPCPKPPVMGPSDNDFHGIYSGVADCRPWGAYGWDFDFLKSLHGNLSLSPSVCGHQGSSTSSQKNEKNSCDDMKKENERGNETGADLSSPLKRIKIFL